MQVRQLPDDLVPPQLRRVHALEQAEDSSPRVGGARAATGTLMLAAVEAGWKTTDIAKVLGMKVGTASQRVYVTPVPDEVTHRPAWSSMNHHLGSAARWPSSTQRSRTGSAIPRRGRRLSKCLGPHCTQLPGVGVQM